MDILCSKAMTSKDDKSDKGGAVKAKDLLAKYGSAYLITSISFAVVSFAICYALVNAGKPLLVRTMEVSS